MTEENQSTSSGTVNLGVQIESTSGFVCDGNITVSSESTSGLDVLSVASNTFDFEFTLRHKPEEGYYAHPDEPFRSHPVR